MNHWINSYSQKGIWGCLHILSKEVEGISWSICIQTNQMKIHINSMGDLIEESSHDICDVTIKTIPQGNLLLIPVYLYKHQVFTFSVTTKYEYSLKKLSEIQFILQLLLEHESLHKTQYPSFLPFLFPYSKISASQYIQQANSAIKNAKNNIIFLNGQLGTGKKTFFQCFMLFRYHLFCHFSEHIKNIYEYDIPDNHLKAIYINEIAQLTYKEQEEIILNLETHNFFYVISSCYSPEILRDKEIISNDFYNLCLKNKYIIPSLANRYDDLNHIVNFLKISKLKSQDFLWEDTFLEEISNNFIGLQKKIYISSEYDLSHWKNSVNDGIKLRDLISRVEIEAIRHAKMKAGNSQYKISKLLGISRGSLQHKLKKYKLPYTLEND